MSSILTYNDDKPHRCPSCHAVADPDQRCKWVAVTCCKCGSQFARWPSVARLLPKPGVVCPEHGDA